MNSHTASVVFWFSVGGLFLTYFGYPLLILFLARGRRRAQEITAPDDWPFVSVVLVARNEAARLPARLRNLVESDYPADRIEIMVVSDGSTDETSEELERFNDQRARLIRQPKRLGKAAGINAGVAGARGELVVFADARQSFAPGTIRALARALLDPDAGAVSGELVIAPSDAGIGQGVDAYWRLERALRRAEATVDSCIGCTGAVYAIRRSLFVPLPEDTILDDVVIPMQIALSGLRVGFSADAKAFDPQPLAPELESRRKKRTLTGNFQMLFRYPEWLLPWRNRLWWQLIAHKYLRLLAPAFLIAAAVANAALLSSPLYRTIGLLQGIFYLSAAIGFIAPGRVFSIPAGFVFLNWQVIRAFFEYLRGRGAIRWPAGSS